MDRLHDLWIEPLVRRWLWDDREVERPEVERLVDGGGLWMINLDGRDIGFCGLREALDWMPGEIELLYGLEPVHWGRGYATEASIALLDLAFEEPGRERILAAVDTPNEASIRVLERLGFRFDREGYLGEAPTKFFSLRKGG